MGKKGDVAGLLRLLGSSDGHLRSEARFYLGVNLGRSDLKQAAISHLIRALSDPSVSAGVAELLGYYKVTEAIDSLVSALKSSDQETRQKAAAALRKMQSPRIIY